MAASSVSMATTGRMVAEYPGWPNGLKVQPDGVLLAADYRHGLVRIDPGDRRRTPR